MARTNSSVSTLRLHRIFKIHHCLRSMQPFSAEELAHSTLDLDSQTNARKIREDIQFLRELGAPIPKGNKHLKFRYEKPFSLLKALEGVNTADTDEVLAYLRQVYQKAPKAAFMELDKVFLALEKRIRASDAQGDPRLQFEKLTYLGEEHLIPLLDFVVKGRTVVFDYEPFSQPRQERMVYPVFLKEFNHRWFLVGFDREVADYQNYALDRIASKPRFSDWTPRIDHLPDPAGYFQDLIGVTRIGEPVQVVVRVHMRRALYIRTKQWHSSQVELNETDSWIDFAWQVRLNRELTARIFELGDDAEVVAPPELRTQVKEILQRAARHYED
jgi:predicted DNA-binding transcriptional regulator YafY